MNYLLSIIFLFSPFISWAQVSRIDDASGNVTYTWSIPKNKDSCNCYNFAYLIYDKANWNSDYAAKRSTQYIADCIQNGLNPNDKFSIAVSDIRKYGLFREKRYTESYIYEFTPFQLACDIGNFQVVELLMPYLKDSDHRVEAYDSLGQRFEDKDLSTLDLALCNISKPIYEDGTSGLKGYYNKDSSIYNLLIKHDVWSMQKIKKVGNDIILKMIDLRGENYRLKYYKKNSEEYKAEMAKWELEQKCLMDDLRELIRSVGSRKLFKVDEIFYFSLVNNIPDVYKFIIDSQDIYFEDPYIEATYYRSKGFFGAFTKGYTSYKSIPWSEYLTKYPGYPTIETMEYFYELGLLKESDLESITQLRGNSFISLFDSYKSSFDTNGGLLFKRYYKKYFLLKKIGKRSLRRKLIENRMNKLRRKLAERNGLT